MAFLLGGGSFAGTLRHDPQVWHRLAFPAQPGKVGGAGILSSPGRPSRSCLHPPASPPNKSQAQSKLWSIKAPWLFCWVREVSPERPGHDSQAGRRPGFPAQPGKGPGWGFPGCSGTDPAAYSWGGFPLRGSFGISNRCDKKSVFYKSVSQPL